MYFQFAESAKLYKWLPVRRHGLKTRFAWKKIQVFWFLWPDDMSVVFYQVLWTKIVCPSRFPQLDQKLFTPSRNRQLLIKFVALGMKLVFVIFCIFCLCHGFLSVNILWPSYYSPPQSVARIIFVQCTNEKEDRAQSYRINTFSLKELRITLLWQRDCLSLRLRDVFASHCCVSLKCVLKGKILAFVMLRNYVSQGWLFFMPHFQMRSITFSVYEFTFCKSGKSGWANSQFEQHSLMSAGQMVFHPGPLFRHKNMCHEISAFSYVSFSVLSYAFIWSHLYDVRESK